MDWKFGGLEQALKEELASLNPSFLYPEIFLCLSCGCPEKAAEQFRVLYAKCGHCELLGRAPADFYEVVFVRSQGMKARLQVQEYRDECLQRSLLLMDPQMQDTYDRYQPGSVVCVQWTITRRVVGPASASASEAVQDPDLSVPVARYEIPLSESPVWNPNVPPLRVDEALWSSPNFLAQHLDRPVIPFRQLRLKLCKEQQPGQRPRRVPATATLQFINRAQSISTWTSPLFCSTILWHVQGGMAWLHHHGTLVTSEGCSRGPEFSEEYNDFLLTRFVEVLMMRDLGLLGLSFLLGTTWKPQPGQDPS
jgi:hypothetical protein